MPLYVFGCQMCGAVQERLLDVSQKKLLAYCDECDGIAKRRFDLEGVAFVPDIEPHYDISLGEHITSRADKRDALRFYNAYDPTMERGGTPTGGLARHEQADIITKGKSRFGSGLKPGLNIDQTNQVDDLITIEGESDRSDSVKAIKDTHRQVLTDKGRADLAEKII